MIPFRDSSWRAHYSIGLVSFNEQTIFSNNLCFHIIANPSGRWFADPFLYDVTSDRFIVFAEEYRYETRIGRIARLEIDKQSFKIIKVEIISDSQTHLSFPIFYKSGTDTYMYPENSSANVLALYKLDALSHRLSYVKDLIRRPIVDSVMYSIGRDSYIFTTDNDYKGGNSNRLIIYRKNNEDYQYYQTVEMKTDCARNAGAILRVAGVDYRVAQDCTNSYGNHLVFQRIHFNQLTGFSFETVSELFPRGKQKGMHTFNVYKDWAIVDFYYNPLSTMKNAYLNIRRWLLKG